MLAFAIHNNIKLYQMDVKSVFSISCSMSVSMLDFNNLIESHLKSIKRHFRYLVGSSNLSLFYEKHNNFMLARFCDVDYATDRVERKNTSEECHFLGNCLISWASKNHNSISLSITKAKYTSVARCCS
uniref:Retrovirus-related Pol polyprotein from transposon TNT 1-94 n=1 Tax=Cajanus cajan TaxID=3821 RepID=A0A151T8R3_CAJCA|nr:hypothetical protein KK1_018020 [Cajanus cajan]